MSILVIYSTEIWVMDASNDNFNDVSSATKELPLLKEKRMKKRKYCMIAFPLEINTPKLNWLISLC